MLQIGRFLCRGQGAMLVTGPLGAALVPLDFADSAADVVWGRADTQAWLSHVQAERGDVLLLDCAGEQPYLTVLGNIQLRMRAAGADHRAGVDRPDLGLALQPRRVADLRGDHHRR